MKKIIAIIWTILSIVAAALPTAAEDYTGPTEIVSESTRVIEENTKAGEGWISCYATVPLGFCGTVYVDFKCSGLFGKTYTAEISAFDYYVGGLWLPEGKYTVERVYDMDGMILGSWALYDTGDVPDTITVANDLDVALKISCTDNPDYIPPEWTGPTNGNSGTLPSPTESVAAVTEEFTTADTTAPSEESPAENKGSGNLLLTFFVTVGFLAIVVGGVILYRKFRKTQTY